VSHSVKQLAKLAHISVRTLHFYDETGLLKPSSIKSNGYRVYEEKELLRLQQILFFRELEFPLAEIKKIMNAPGFDIVQALKSHKKLIEVKQKRLTGLLATIESTIKSMKSKKPIEEKALYDHFDDAEQKKYQQEAKERWGNTEAYKQSQERTKHWTKADYEKLKKDGDTFMKTVVATMPKGIASKEIQTLVQQWREGINVFYDTNIEMCRNLATMYTADPRFTKYYEKYAKGLAVFWRDAIYYYCDRAEK
jgi:DNA-binding transcriptional MerR regulator